MAKVIFIICISITALFCFSFQVKEKSNVTIILHLDEELSQIEQKVYVSSFCQWISGAEQCIWDSTLTQKGQKTIVLQAYTPIENEFKIAFAKEGPAKLAALALPGDTVELNVGYKDENPTTIYKKATKGAFHNTYTQFHLIQAMHWNKKHKLNEEHKKDSVVLKDKELVSFYQNHIEQTKHPLIARRGAVMLKVFFSDYIDKDALQAIEEHISKTFPDDPRSLPVYGSNRTQTERGIRAAKRITEIERERKDYKRRKRINATGSIINLNLNGIDGEPIPLSSLTNKYTYIDVWASWCKPCRMQFPHIKQALSKYSEDLKVYAISIDYNHDLWKEAIKKDSLQSFIHVIGTNNNRRILKEVEDLGVERIPKSFLLDKNHRIIAKDLHDGRLIEVLDSLTTK